MSQKIVTVSLESPELQDVQRILLSRDDAGEPIAILHCHLRRDIGGVEQTQVQVPLTPAERTQLRQWITGVLLPRASTALGFPAP